MTIVGGWLFMTGCLAFIWFAGVLRSRLADAEGGNPDTLSTIGYAGAVAAAAVFGIRNFAGGCRKCRSTRPT